MLEHTHLINFQACDFPFKLMSDSVRQVIMLSNSESIELRFCQCDLQVPLSIVQALPAILRLFWVATMVSCTHL